MKRYIKPETTLFKAEGEQILAAVSSNPSLNTTPGGSMDPWGGAAKPHKPEGVLDFSWDDEGEEEENN